MTRAARGTSQDGVNPARRGQWAIITLMVAVAVISVITVLVVQDVRSEGSMTRPTAAAWTLAAFAAFAFAVVGTDRIAREAHS